MQRAAVPPRAPTMSPSSPAESRPRSPWPLVALLCATATAGYLCRVNVSTAGALLMEEFGLTQAQLGRVFSAFLLGYALTMVPGGALADLWGARRVLVLATWAWVALTLAQAVAGWGPLAASSGVVLAGFMALRFLLGVAAAPTYPASAAGVSAWVPRPAQGRATGIVLASIGLGSAISPPLLSFVMVSWGWRAALLVSAAPAVIVGAIWALAPRPPAAGTLPVAAARGDRASAGPGRLLRSGGFALLTASYTLQGYIGYIFVFWFYLYLVQERRFDLLQGAWVSSVPWLLCLVSIPGGGWLADRAIVSRLGPTWGARVVPMAGLAASGVLISVGARTSDAWVAAVALALATALVLSVEGPFWSTLTRLAGASSGTAGGVMNLGSNVGGLVSPALTPALAAWIGWEHALHVAAALAVVAAVLWLGIDAGAGPPSRDDHAGD